MPFPYLDRYIAAIHLTTLDVAGYRFHLARFEHAAQAQMSGWREPMAMNIPISDSARKKSSSALPEGICRHICGV